MIASLRGTVIAISEKSIVIECGGIGYRVFCTADTLTKFIEETTVFIFIYSAIREDAHELYGFLREDERNLFEQLLSVSGIGPKSALGILGLASIELLAHAIASGDTGYLTKVSGIGRKTAEKIVIELRDKIRASVNINDVPKGFRVGSDVVEALKVLGYQERAIRDALSEIDEALVDTNDQIRAALKVLGK